MQNDSDTRDPSPYALDWPLTPWGEEGGPMTLLIVTSYLVPIWLRSDIEERREELPQALPTLTALISVLADLCARSLFRCHSVQSS